MRRRWLTFGLFVTAPVILLAQQEGRTFRSGVHLIVQTVSVNDKNGKSIEGLTAKDFVVTENGVSPAGCG